MKMSALEEAEEVVGGGSFGFLVPLLLLPIVSRDPISGSVRRLGLLADWMVLPIKHGEGGPGNCRASGAGTKC